MKDQSQSQSHSQAQQQQDALKEVAQETLGVLPRLLNQVQRTDAARTAHKYSKDELRYLDPNSCPAHKHPATIRVVNSDTINAAIQLSHAHAHHDEKPPLIVNFANASKPGGGWRNGKLAQEEAICYRSSLAHSLDNCPYPLAWDEVVYSPYVLVVRDDMARGHALLQVPPAQMPVVSCVTVAALREPAVRTFAAPRARVVFDSDKDRSVTKAKMRLTLRAAAKGGHASLVLGALGCGVYANPPEDVAHCWLEVLREHEFDGHWWRDVWFAVYDPKGDGNFDIFDRVLSGKQV